MRFLANENYPLPSIRLLRASGYEVSSIAESGPGMSDSAVLALARAEHRIILTFDRNYGELIYRKHLGPPAGLVYYRLVPMTPNEPAELLNKILQTSNLQLEARFTVVTREVVRQRPLLVANTSPKG